MTAVSPDTVADMLTRIRNALMVRQQWVEAPHSQLKENLAQTLKDHDYIVDYTVKKDPHKTLQLQLFKAGTNSAIVGLERVSKPGRRVYVGKDEIPQVLGGHGIAILSTSHGVLATPEARKRGIGGELLCKVW